MQHIQPTLLLSNIHGGRVDSNFLFIMWLLETVCFSNTGKHKDRLKDWDRNLYTAKDKQTFALRRLTNFTQFKTRTRYSAELLKCLKAQHIIFTTESKYMSPNVMPLDFPSESGKMVDSQRSSVSQYISNVLSVTSFQPKGATHVVQPSAKHEKICLHTVHRLCYLFT
jgi:hypothetical protein